MEVGRDRHSYRVRQPVAPAGKPVQELVGAAGRVGVDQRVPAPPWASRALREGVAGHLDVVGGGVGAGVTGLSSAATGSPVPSGFVVDEREEEAEPGRQRGGVLRRCARCGLRRCRARCQAVDRGPQNRPSGAATTCTLTPCRWSLRSRRAAQRPARWQSGCHRRSRTASDAAPAATL